MKIDAATIRVIYGIGQKMVKIHNHSQNHNQPCRPPALFKKKGSNQTGNYKMQGKVKRRMQHGYLFKSLPHR
jgi:hypothetical protein